MENPRFSVVIPTRNRADTLKYCLKTCIEQHDFENYEIIVCDNNSTPATKEVVDELNSIKIRYISTGRTLAMYENFDFALSQAKGEYVIALGDDDGLLLRGLYNLDKIITQTNFKVVAWNWVFYYWPTGVTPGYENYLQIPLDMNVRVVNGKQCIKEVINFKVTYPHLPMLYINSAIHRDLIAELKTKTGRIISSVTPDSYSGVCFAYLSKLFLYLEKPITIAGISGNSNGNNQFTKKWDNNITKEFNDLNDSAVINFNNKIPNIRSINAIVSEAFVQAKQRLFPDDEDLIVDRKQIIIHCLKDTVMFDKAEWANNINIIRSSLADDAELTAWFNEYILNVEPVITAIDEKKVPFRGLHIKERVIALDASSFNCLNVYDVAKFYNKAFEGDIFIPTHVVYKEIEQQPTNVKISLSRRIINKIKRVAGM